MKLNKIFIFFILFTCIPIEYNKEYTTIEIGENKMLKRINEEFEIEVSAEGVVESIGFSGWISFNPTIIEVVDIGESVGTQPDVTDMGFFSNAQLLVGIQKDVNGVEQPGTLVCGYVSIPPEPKSGDGVFFRVRFKAIAQGETDINFVTGHMNLQDINGDIPADGIGDSVEVPVNATVKITVL